MYCGAIEKIETQFKELKINDLTNNQLVKFFQTVDLALPKDADLSQLDCDLITDVFQIYLARVKRFYQNLSYLTVDGFEEHILGKLPERFKDLVGAYLDDTFGDVSKIEVHEFESHIVKMVANDKFVAVADDRNLILFDNEGNKCKEFNLINRTKYTFGFSPNNFVFIADNEIWCYDRSLELVRKLTVGFCPDHIDCITDDVIQFYFGDQIGNLILAETCQVYVFESTVKSHFRTKICFALDGVNFYADGKKLAATTYDFNYSLVKRMRERADNDFSQLLLIRNSKLFTQVRPILRAKHVKEMKEMVSGIASNERLFKF